MVTCRSRFPFFRDTRAPSWQYCLPPVLPVLAHKTMAGAWRCVLDGFGFRLFLSNSDDCSPFDFFHVDLSSRDVAYSLLSFAKYQFHISDVLCRYSVCWVVGQSPCGGIIVQRKRAALAPRHAWNGKVCSFTTVSDWQRSATNARNPIDTNL